MSSSPDHNRRTLPPSGPALDAYGVPTRMLGHHADDTWALVGRTVGLTPILESRLTALIQSLRLKSPTEYANLPASEVVRELRDEAPTDHPDWCGWTDWLDRVTLALMWRNSVVHNLWSPKGESGLYGYRLTRSGDLTHDTITVDDLRTYLLELVALVDEAQVWLARAGAETSRRMRDRE